MIARLIIRAGFAVAGILCLVFGAQMLLSEYREPLLGWGLTGGYAAVEFLLFIFCIGRITTL